MNMDAQMEEEVLSAKNEGIVPNGNHPTSQPLRIPAGQISMVTMSISEEDYARHYWPKLQAAIEQLLNLSPGSYSPLSYEQMYSCVYKCVCKQFSERLYNDLMSFMGQHCDKLNALLAEKANDRMQFVETFAQVLNHYLQSLQGIVPIFNYMNRFYVESKLHLDLKMELLKLFASKCVDCCINQLLDFLEEVNATPFAMYPTSFANLIKNLHTLNSEYCRMRPNLFSKFIPSVLPPTSVSRMDHYIAETQEWQKNLRETPGFEMCARQKRPCEDDATIS